MLLAGLDVALLEELFGLGVHHQQGGLIAVGFDGRHHLRVLHADHRHAVDLMGGGGGRRTGLLAEISGEVAKEFSHIFQAF